MKAQTGEELFKSNCASCHRVGGGKLVGPDLKGISELRSEDWLVKWIKSSQTLINSGDKDAIAVFEENNKIPMPDQHLSDSEINLILAYINDKSSPAEVSNTATSESIDNQEPIKSSEGATEDEIMLGQNIFEGSTRLINGGPACISCHNLATDRIIPGGLLAKDLTTVFKRMGGDAGITAILNAPPFPAMTEAYKNKSITEAEIFAITAFLNKVEKESEVKEVSAMSPLLKYGFIGFAIWLCIVLVLWRNKKGAMVKQKIFDRQVLTR